MRVHTAPCVLLSLILVKNTLHIIKIKFLQSDTDSIPPKEEIKIYKPYVIPSALVTQGKCHKTNRKKEYDGLVICTRNQERKDDKNRVKKM